MEGLIEQSAHGIHNVELDNKLKAVCTARKLDSIRVSLLPGDRVVCEIPTAGLEPGASKLKARIVWRIKN